MDKTLVQYNTKMKKVFEGYYFKHTFDNKAISFIVGFSTVKKHAFIQVIESHPTISHYYHFDINDLIISNNPFSITIEDNYFSFEKIVINLDEYHGEFIYGELTPLKPMYGFDNIMGPFSALPRMQCNHAIVSMDHDVTVDFQIRDAKYQCNGKGYIEKDYGRSFPKNYIWLQCNNFNDGGSFFFSLATIPYLKWEFDGIIANFAFENLEYRFATYNNSTYEVIRCEEDYFQVVLRHKKITLEVIVTIKEKAPLLAPIDGEMIDTIKDGMTGELKIAIYDGEELVHEDSSNLVAIEIVNSSYFQKNGE